MFNHGRRHLLFEMFTFSYGKQLFVDKKKVLPAEKEKNKIVVKVLYLKKKEWRNLT